MVYFEYSFSGKSKLYTRCDVLIVVCYGAVVFFLATFTQDQSSWLISRLFSSFIASFTSALSIGFIASLSLVY